MDLYIEAREGTVTGARAPHTCYLEAVPGDFQRMSLTIPSSSSSFLQSNFCPFPSCQGRVDDDGGGGEIESCSDAGLQRGARAGHPVERFPRPAEVGPFAPPFLCGQKHRRFQCRDGIGFTCTSDGTRDPCKYYSDTRELPQASRGEAQGRIRGQKGGSDPPPSPAPRSSTITPNHRCLFTQISFLWLQDGRDGRKGFRDRTVHLP
jgi:hypothetical protein